MNSIVPQDNIMHEKIYRWHKQQQSGYIKANNPALARYQLRLQNIIPARLQRHYTVAHQKTLSTQQKKQFYQNLHQLLSSGFPLDESLLLLSEESDDAMRYFLFQAMAQQTRAGHPLHHIWQQQAHAFSSMEHGLLYVAEQSGQSLRIFQQLSDYYRHHEQLKKTIRKALAYPCFILVSALIAIALLLLFVVPQISALYASFDQDLPALTNSLIHTANALHDHTLTLGLALLLFIGLCLGIRQRPSLKQWFSRRLNRLPLLNALFTLHQRSQLYQILYTLLAAGTPMMDALQQSQQALHNANTQQQLKQVIDTLHGGQSIHQSFMDSTLCSTKDLKRIKLAEHSGQLEHCFQQLAKEYREMSMEKTTRFAKTIEPAMMIVFGGLLGLMITAMYLPLFQLGSLF
jgi:type II secretory pathway component PulF